MSPDYLSRDNVLVVSFGEDPQNDTNAYQALTDLKQLDSQGQIEIAGAAVVTRDPDDRVDVKTEVANDPYVGTASGSIIGLLIGIIGGPLGVLLGGTYGMLVGSLFDIDDVETIVGVARDDGSAGDRDLALRVELLEGGERLVGVRVVLRVFAEADHQHVVT